MTANPEPDARQRSRTILRQKLESLYRSGIQQLTKTAPVRNSSGAGSSDRSGTASGAAARIGPSVPAIRPPGPSRRGGNHPPASRPGGRPRRSAPARRRPTPAISAAPLPLDQRVAALAAVRNEVVLCRRCDELAQKRTQTVFGVGHPHPRLCFLGERQERTKIAKASPSWVPPASCWTRSSPPAH